MSIYKKRYYRHMDTNGKLGNNTYSRQYQFSRSVISDSLQPHDCSTPDFPVHHQLLETAQTHVHQIGDAIQPFHPLSSPLLPAFNLSQHQGISSEAVLCIRGRSIGVLASASVLLMNIQNWFPLRLTGLILQSNRLSRVCYNNTVQKHQFFGTQLSL